MGFGELAAALRVVRPLLSTRTMTRMFAALAIAVVAAGCSNSDPTDAAPDAGAEAPDSGTGAPSDCGMNPAVRWDLLAETLQLESAGGDTCLVVERRNDCPPDWICKAVPFTILEARIGHGGDVVVQTESAQMTWHETHHNWSDAADIDAAGVRYHLEFAFGNPGQYELSARQGDAPVWGPVVLHPVNP